MTQVKESKKKRKKEHINEGDKWNVNMME